MTTPTSPPPTYATPTPTPATWLTTEEVIERLGAISREALTALMTAPVEPRPWVVYSGTPGTRSARYRWRAEHVDTWFEEACRWRASNSRTGDGSSDGAKGDGTAPSAPSPAPASAGRTRSPRRSKSKSTAPGGTSLVELADRLLRR